ncbi:MAG: hypothetical protein MHM6MM_004798 [Cercozoa sp. M6MM]
MLVAENRLLSKKLMRGLDDVRSEAKSPRRSSRSPKRQSRPGTASRRSSSVRVTAKFYKRRRGKRGQKRLGERNASSDFDNDDLHDEAEDFTLLSSSESEDEELRKTLTSKTPRARSYEQRSLTTSKSSSDVAMDAESHLTKLSFKNREIDTLRQDLRDTEHRLEEQRIKAAEIPKLRATLDSTALERDRLREEVTALRSRYRRVVSGEAAVLDDKTERTEGVSGSSELSLRSELELRQQRAALRRLEREKFQWETRAKSAEQRAELAAKEIARLKKTNESLKAEMKTQLEQESKSHELSLRVKTAALERQIEQKEWELSKAKDEIEKWKTEAKRTLDDSEDAISLEHAQLNKKHQFVQRKLQQQLHEYALRNKSLRKQLTESKHALDDSELLHRLNSFQRKLHRLEQDKHSEVHTLRKELAVREAAVQRLRGELEELRSSKQHNEDEATCRENELSQRVKCLDKQVLQLQSQQHDHLTHEKEETYDTEEQEAISSVEEDYPATSEDAETLDAIRSAVHEAVDDAMVREYLRKLERKEETVGKAIVHELDQEGQTVDSEAATTVC